MRLPPILPVLLFCAACGPPQLTGTISDSETSHGSTASGSTASTSDSTDTSSTDTSSTDTGSTASDTNIFIHVGDTICDLRGCDPFAQDCPDGEKCVPYASTGRWWDDNRCVPVLGSQASGEPCISAGIVEVTDDCDEFGFCWNAQEIEGEMVGTCHSFCAGTHEMPECPEGYECLLSSDSVVTLCFPMCDPVAQDCVDDLACYWSGSAFICTATVDPPGTPLGQPCGYVNDCEAGSLCVDASVMPDCAGTSCCGSFCDLGLGDAQCAAVPGTTCVPFWEQGLAPANFEHVGICIVGP